MSSFEDPLTASLKLQFGRCSVRRFFPGALRVLEANKELFAGFIENRIRWEQAEQVSG